MTIHECVMRGITLLDENKPDWREVFTNPEQISKRSNFNLTDERPYILEYIYGNYTFGIASLNLSPIRGREYGFMAGLFDQDDLCQVWREALFGSPLCHCPLDILLKTGCQCGGK